MRTTVFNVYLAGARTAGGCCGVGGQGMAPGQQSRDRYGVNAPNPQRDPAAG